MYIVFQKPSPEQVAIFFKKNNYRINRLLALCVMEKSCCDSSDNQPEAPIETEAEEILVAVVDEAEEEIVATAEHSDDNKVEEEKTLSMLLAIEPDDLSSIKGLGKKTVEKLAEEGIVTFLHLSTLSEEKISALDEKISHFSSKYKSKNWRGQAESLIKA